MTREPLAIDNLHIVIKVLAVVQLLGMAHRSIPSSNQGVQDPGFTGYPEVFQFREMMRTLSAHIARQMGLTRQSVQRTVDLLAADGLVAFADNQHHRRAKLVDFTPRGSTT